MEITGCSPNDCRCFNECTSIHDGLYPPCASNTIDNKISEVTELKTNTLNLINILNSSYQVDDGKRFSDTMIKLRKLLSLE
jgi:hypothetical protein